MIKNKRRETAVQSNRNINESAYLNYYFCCSTEYGAARGAKIICLHCSGHNGDFYKPRSDTGRLRAATAVHPPRISTHPQNILGYFQVNALSIIHRLPNHQCHSLYHIRMIHFRTGQWRIQPDIGCYSRSLQTSDKQRGFAFCNPGLQLIAISSGIITPQLQAVNKTEPNDYADLLNFVIFFAVKLMR